MTDAPNIEMKSSSFQEIYQQLHTAYMARLKSSTEAISNILAQQQLKAMSKDDLARAQSMVHNLAGSGTTFGFPEVTSTSQKAETFIEKLMRGMSAEDTLSAEDFAGLETVMTAVSTACTEALNKQEQTPGYSPAVADSLRKPQEPFFIMIVDDDPHLSGLLSMKLQQRGIRVSVAESGERAMDSISRNRPDLIILDISMPGMSGHEVLRRVKQTSELVDIPVLMLTGQADQKAVVSALHSGAIDYIVKPCDPDMVLTRVEKILDAARYTILIADNDPLVLHLMESKFRYAGFKIVLVDDGQKAWDKIQKILPDLVILDRMMPGLEGLSVVQKMREEQATKDIPVIIVSARKEDRDIEMGKKFGAQSYFVKPFIPSDLINESLSLLERKKQANS